MTHKVAWLLTMASSLLMLACIPKRVPSKTATTSDSPLSTDAFSPLDTAAPDLPPSPEAWTELPRVDDGAPPIAIDVSLVEPDVPLVGPDVPAIEADVALVGPDVPAIEADVPLVEPDVPAIEADVPATEADVPLVEPDVDPVAGVVYYVRPGGGNTYQCSGLSDKDYPGSGTNQNCAFKHPFYALPPGRKPVLKGGDTLMIAAGSYRMGIDAPNTGDGNCDKTYPWLCHMPAVPSGPSAERPTRILGVGWDSGCKNPPELYGVERSAMVFNLTGSSHVELNCLEITDHMGCVDFHPGSRSCPRSGYPNGDWAETGIFASDSNDVTLRQLNIHGLAYRGIHAGRLKDWLVEDVRLVANGWAGWDGRLSEPGKGDANTGTITFRRLHVEWTGCAESYPQKDPVGCFNQSYGDAIGVGKTGGAWLIEDSTIRNNASDGVDLSLLVDGSVTVQRSRIEGNVRTQLRLGGDVTLENNVIVGNCSFFDGKSYNESVDSCKDDGNTLVLVMAPGVTSQLVNNTITGEGDILIEARPGSGTQCDGTESLLARNNIFLGQPQYKLYPSSSDDLVQLFAAPSCPSLWFDADYGVVSSMKWQSCPGDHDICADPRLKNASVHAFDPALRIDSPAIDSGVWIEGLVPTSDFAGTARPPENGVDRGALEFGD